MKLIELTAEQLSALYESELKAAFPPQELKPLKAMLNLMAEKKYQALGLYDGDELVGYALLWLEPGIPFALLDYLGTIEGRRSQGLGTIILDLLAGYYKDYRGIFGEAEAPEGGSPEGEELRRRRLGFYLRNGFRYGGYDCALFGVHYQTLIRGREDVTPGELLAVHQKIYSGHMPKQVYDRFIQIPLLPGQQPNSMGDWVEE
ncbi:Uncharacterised protein [uncultured Flavonifractor sp.]|nr:Uncharacterised protein [uncultured Flavonifractor sp.]